jgi:hypothetical protein
MDDLPAIMEEYRRQMQTGLVPRAYRAVMDYMLDLRAELARNHPDYTTSNSLYFGYMDMTYFAFISPALVARKLKPAVVFIHQTTSFELWLAAANKQIQLQYWNLFRGKGYNRYRLLDDLRGEDAILIHSIPDPDFGDLPGLTARIERESMRFITDIEDFLSGCES